MALLVHGLPRFAVVQAKRGSEVDDLCFLREESRARLDRRPGRKREEHRVAARRLIGMDQLEAEPVEVRVMIVHTLFGAARQPRDLDLGVVEENAERFPTHVARGAHDADPDHR
jgi:hypothetical protein